MKRFIYIFILILTIYLLTGCETHKEISELGMVSAMGIEKKDGKFLISVQVANIKKSTNMGIDNSSKVTLYEESGDTSFEAIRKITKKSSKKLYFPHIKIIIVSDEIINENPFQIVDFFSRDNEGNINAYLLVTKDISPNSILSTVTPFEDVPAEYIYNLITISNISYGNTSILRYEDYVKNLITDGIDPSFTKISITKKDDIKNNTDELNTIKLNTYIELGNILVFNKEKKLEELNKDESIIFNIIKGNKTNLLTTLKCDNNNNYTSLEIMNNSSDIKFNKNKIIINLSLDYSISEYNCDNDLLNKKNIEILKNKLKEKLKSDINDLLNKSIQYESDFIGFGSIIKSKDKNYFDFKNNNWNKEGLIYLRFDTNINISIENRGDLLSVIRKEKKYE